MLTQEELLKVKDQLILVENVQLKNCQRSLRELIFQYDNLIRKITINSKLKFNRIPLETEDIINVLKNEFVELVKKYDVKRGMSLPNYLQKYLSFGVMNYLRKFIQQNHQVMNYCTTYLEEIKGNNDSFESESIYDEIDEIIKFSNLTENEEFVVREHILNGETIIDLSILLKKSIQSIYLLKTTAIKKMHKFQTSKL